MKREDGENPQVVTVSVLLAFSGVVLLRMMVNMNYHHWPVTYLAMGLTASIRRTSAGSNCTVGSASRGVACLIAGLCACHWLGYPVLSTDRQRVKADVGVKIEMIR